MMHATFFSRNKIWCKFQFIFYFFFFLINSIASQQQQHWDVEYLNRWIERERERCYSVDDDNNEPDIYFFFLVNLIYSILFEWWTIRLFLGSEGVNIVTMSKIKSKMNVNCFFNCHLFFFFFLSSSFQIRWSQWNYNWP